MLGQFLGRSLDIAGLGGLFAGVFAKSYRSALLWSALWGAVGALALFLLLPTAGIADFTLSLILGLFWGHIGWLTVGLWRSRRRRPKT